MSAPTKYTIYELLRFIVERTGWQTEQMKNDLLATVNEAEKTNAVGVIGVMMACSHPPEMRKPLSMQIWRGVEYPSAKTQCQQCGREFQ